MHIFLTSTLAGREWLASRQGALSTGKEPPVPIGQEIRRTPKSRFGRRGEEKIFSTYRGSNSDPSVVQPIDYEHNRKYIKHSVKKCWDIEC
jgi:hypothetical protein